MATAALHPLKTPAVSVVQAVAVYELGEVPPDAVNVTFRAPAVVVDDVTARTVGASTWLVAACGPAIADVDARYPVEATAVTVT
jgi:hypothetical protein